jgi:hypothetical protein
MYMLRHLSICFALLLAALLPLGVASAADGCLLTPTFTVTQDNGCDCPTDNPMQCQASCSARCQVFQGERRSDLAGRDLSSILHSPDRPIFSRFLPNGPEPPPPRFFR